MNRRSESRLLLELPGSYVTSAGSRPMYFSDLSANGCRIAPVDVAVGDMLNVYLGLIGPLQATARWTRDGSSGVQFEVPLDAEVVAYFAGFCARAA